ncbi:hypothetical protein pb186bvf_012671 [Paramecium bursaria]
MDIKDYTYLLQGFFFSKILSYQDIRPSSRNILHKMFQCYSQDPGLAQKLCEKVLQFENPNDVNQEGWTALHLAVRYSQYQALVFAIHDGRFDFTVQGGPQKYSLMHLAVIKQNHRIIELLMDQQVSFFWESIDGILPRKLGMQSQTNIKIIKRYEIMELRKQITDQENLEDDESTDLNTMREFSIKTNCKNVIYSTKICQIPQTREMKVVEIKLGLNLLNNENFIDEAISKLFKWEDPFCSMILILLLENFNKKLNFNQMGQIIARLDIKFPQSHQKVVVNNFKLKYLPHTKEIKRNLIYYIQELRYKLKLIPDQYDQNNQESILNIRKSTSNKLVYDIKNYAFFPLIYQNIYKYSMISQYLYHQIGDPTVKVQNNHTTLLQYEHQHKVKIQRPNMQSFCYEEKILKN